MTGPSHPLVIAHRGASGYRPEHSRAAYELALALGADAVEPDIVATRDGVLVLRHENEISGTTDVASRPEFAERRVTKEVDGHPVTGWFTEDFTWAELSTLRVRERLPRVRQPSSTFDGLEPILRLRDLLPMLAGRATALVAELKHASYFESIGLPLDELFAAEIAGWSGPLVVEAFEQTVLRQLRTRGVRAEYVFLAEATGAPADLVARHGRAAPRYAEHLTDAGLARLAEEVDGVSVNKRLLLATDASGAVTGASELPVRAHDAGLRLFCWTLRAENRFLAPNLRRGTAAAHYGDWMGEFRMIMSSGVDAVFADQPDLALAARATL